MVRLDVAAAREFISRLHPGPPPSPGSIDPSIPHHRLGRECVAMTSGLGHLHVLELGGGLAASMVGKLVADLGATVVKIEPPGGDPTRQRGPFRGQSVPPTGMWSLQPALAQDVEFLREICRVLVGL